jgi:hypothetical protein
MRKSDSRRAVVFAFVFVIASMGTATKATEPSIVVPGDSYSLPTCAILETELGEKAEVFKDGEREIRVCCVECVDQFAGQRTRWIDEMDKQFISQQLPHYPLTKCIVDDAPLLQFVAGFGTVNAVVRNRLFRLCSGKCRRALEQAPDRYFRQLDVAVIAGQKETYPLTTCLVSGKPLTEKSIDHVLANQLIRLADAKQLDAFKENPAKYLTALDEARQRSSGRQAGR